MCGNCEQEIADLQAAVAGLILNQHAPINPYNLIPIPDNEDDNNLRTGSAGTSPLYSHGDHNHAIKRLALPAYPVWTWTMSDGGTHVTTANMFRWSDEETVYIRQRHHFELTQTTGWVWANGPGIAGFQRPLVDNLSTYHPEATAGYEMKSYAAEWTNVPRIYLNQYATKDDTDDRTWYLTTVMQYIKL